jgi:hypothetical protein
MAAFYFERAQPYPAIPLHTLSKGRGKSRVTTPVPLPLPSHTLHHYPGGFAYPWYSLTLRTTVALSTYKGHGILTHTKELAESLELAVSGDVFFL